MRRYQVELSPELLDDLERYELVLLERVSPDRAAAIIDLILATARGLATTPIRGTDWSVIEEGLRSLPIARRGTLIFHVDEAGGQVRLLGWWWRGAPITSVIERYRGG